MIHSPFNDIDTLDLSPEEARARFGVMTRHQRMPNGEYRFRLLSDDGGTYVRTVASPRGSWQRSHAHATLREIYVVQSGWMALALKRFGQLEIQILEAGTTVEINGVEPHNVFLSAGTVIHTIKFGGLETSDWIASPELDEATLSLSAADIVRIAKA